MDGTNCRSPMGCGMNREGAIEQTWQSNRAVRMENVGQTDVVDPWLSNGRNNFRNIKEIVASAVTPGMSDGEKARALWYQQIQHRYHSSAGGEDLGDPVKVFNIYGLNPCGKDAMMMGGLWKQVGLKGAPVRLVGHAIAQVHYDGEWHVMDGDLGMIYLLRDNETLASDRQLARDHDLVKRTHTMGILVDDSRMRDERAAAMFVSEEPIQGSRACKEDTTMTDDPSPRRGDRLALGALEAGQVHVAQPIPLPGQHLQRPVGIPAGLRRRGVEEGRDEG